MLAIGAGAALLLWYALRNPGKVLAAPVVTLGEALGIPATDEQMCRAALADGRTWDASFYCPAGTFLTDPAGLPGLPGRSLDAVTGTLRVERPPMADLGDYGPQPLNTGSFWGDLKCVFGNC
jgi:hypothetical protein